MTADRQTAEPPPTDRLCLSVAEAADQIRVSPRQVYTLAHKAGLPTILLGGRRLIRRSDLEAWLAAQPVDRPGTDGPRERWTALQEDSGKVRTAGGGITEPLAGEGNRP